MTTKRMRRQWPIAVGAVIVACNAKPRDQPDPRSSTAPSAASSSVRTLPAPENSGSDAPQAVADADTNRPHAIPLGRRRIFWSRSSKRVAIDDRTGCHDGPCGERKDGWRVVEIGAPESEHEIDADMVFGFRADGETLVVQRGSEAELVDWSIKTRSGRVSDFARAALGAESVCFSPDDVHLVAVDPDGIATWRSIRSGEDPVRLSGPPEAVGGAPTACAFSLSGKALVLATDDTIAIYLAGTTEPERWLPVAKAEDLAWSTDERFVTFAVPNKVRGDGSNLFYVWEPARDHADLLSLGGPAAVDPTRRQIIERAGCNWSRLAFDGKRLGAAKQRDERNCFHVYAQEVAVAPNGAFIAVAEGAWGSSHLVLRPLP